MVSMKSDALTLVSSVVLIVLFVGTFLMPVATATIEAFSVTFEPKYMDLYDQEEPVTATIRFKASKGEDQKVFEINTSTVYLEGSVEAIPDSNDTRTKPPEYWCDFGARSVINILWLKITHMPYNPQGNYIVDLTITGKLYDGTPFTGTGHIQVKGRYLTGPPPPPPPS
jgi:hypothetical protein